MYIGICTFTHIQIYRKIEQYNRSSLSEKQAHLQETFSLLSSPLPPSIPWYFFPNLLYLCGS